MKRPLRFALALAAAMVLVPFLPLYVARSMVRSMVVGHAGDVISWGWRLCTLRGYWADYNYFRPEERPALWLAFNVALGLVYALILGLWVDRVFLHPRFNRGRGVSTLMSEPPAGPRGVI